MASFSMISLNGTRYYVVPKNKSIAPGATVIADAAVDHTRDELQWLITPSTKPSNDVTIRPKDNTGLYLSYNSDNDVVELTMTPFRWQFEAINEAEKTYYILPMNEQQNKVLAKNGKHSTKLILIKKSEAPENCKEWQLVDV